MRIVLGTGLLALAAGAAWAEPSLERGTYLVEGPMGCGNCHTPMGPTGEIAGQELSGRLVEQTDLFTAIAPNITPAGEVAEWSDEELARAIREGITPDGDLIGPPMPILLYRHLSDDDVMSVVMYLRQVPAVENDPGESEYNIPLPPSYGPPVESVASIPAGVTVEYGEYLAGPVAHCVECHSPMGPQGPMTETHTGGGGMEFRGPWGVVVAPPIYGAALEHLSDSDLDSMIRRGMRPTGTPMNPPMPYAHFARMTDEDLAAIILYLRQLPAPPAG